MAMADKIIQRAQEHVEPGEIIQGAFAAQMTITNRGGDPYRIVVATDRRFLLFQSGRISQTVIKRLIGESSRDQLLGEPSGMFYNVTVGEETMKVNFRYFAQVRTIDGALRPS
jgi:hypothetical protein